MMAKNVRTFSLERSTLGRITREELGSCARQAAIPITVILAALLNSKINKTCNSTENWAFPFVPPPERSTKNPPVLADRQVFQLSPESSLTTPCLNTPNTSLGAVSRIRSGAFNAGSFGHVVARILSTVCSSSYLISVLRCSRYK